MVAKQHRLPEAGNSSKREKSCQRNEIRMGAASELRRSSLLHHGARTTREAVQAKLQLEVRLAGPNLFGTDSGVLPKSGTAGPTPSRINLYSATTLSSTIAALLPPHLTWPVQHQSQTLGTSTTVPSHSRAHSNASPRTNKKDAYLATSPCQFLAPGRRLNGVPIHEPSLCRRSATALPSLPDRHYIMIPPPSSSPINSKFLLPFCSLSVPANPHYGFLIRDY